MTTRDEKRCGEGKETETRNNNYNKTRKIEPSGDGRSH
jgi:hypothetical protein